MNNFHVGVLYFLELNILLLVILTTELSYSPFHIHTCYKKAQKIYVQKVLIAPILLSKFISKPCVVVNFSSPPLQRTDTFAS